MAEEPEQIFNSNKNFSLRSNPQAKQAVALANNSSVFQTTGTRRSKRTRKCKGDLDVLASSYDTIKKVKMKVCFFC